MFLNDGTHKVGWFENNVFIGPKPKVKRSSSLNMMSKTNHDYNPNNDFQPNVNWQSVVYDPETTTVDQAKLKEILDKKMKPIEEDQPSVDEEPEVIQQVQVKPRLIA